MFKSIFAKYITTFMLVIFVSIVLSTTVFTTLVKMYDANNKNRALTNVAYESSSYLMRDYNSMEALDFTEYICDNYERLCTVLNAMSVNLDDVVIFVVDSNGQIRIAAGSDNYLDYAASDGLVRDNLLLSDRITDTLNEGDSVLDTETLDGFFKENTRTYIRPICTVEGDTVGSVMSFSVNSDIDELLETMIKSIIVSTLWLMLASLVAVYFITEKMVSPLREMSNAAKEFARGQFDVRIPVHGDDEVTELAKAFNNMASSLQQSDETRRLFLANVSHDLRTPMTTISGFIDSILSGAIPQAEVPHYLEVISSEVRRLSRLVTSLLDITKIQAGERKFTMQPFDICEMAREIIIASEQRLEDKKLDVEFDAEHDNMFVNADRDAIHQVLYNLCDNGIKFSREQGKYTVRIRDIASNKTEISVYNEGEGIAPEDIPYVFDRFFKSDRSRGLDKTGAGLGLYISKTIISSHHEELTVESEHGKWCRFTFTLPKADVPKLKDDKRNIED